ncbi:uncharacterized protein A4U43_C01F19840 [Asparagus officinalis]|uniref:Rubisco LSMT substrate-binding domain-containing protein n=1 Tax=Asparagus officinalis TaxID=4686 RepID=A0A5P1FT64_ASPOF|nr:uncharacterized protein A4U43_C01F19840 [Asparagus officinalis]
MEEQHRYKKKKEKKADRRSCFVTTVAAADFWALGRETGAGGPPRPSRPWVSSGGLGCWPWKDVARTRFPRGIPKEPVDQSRRTVAGLRGTQLLSTTEGVKEYVQGEFIKVEDEIIVPNQHLFPSVITFTDFLWAFGVLRSRAFSGLRGENLVLIPLADLVNHNPSITLEEPSWEIKGKGLFSKELVFSLWTPVSVKAGQQVYIQYDVEKSNAELALDYGFIESNSDRNAYTLTLEIAESDPFYGDKLDIAELNGLGETAYFDIVLGCSLPQSMLQYLRLVSLGGTDAFLLESIFRNKVWGHLELPVSRANEEMICCVVRNACKTALSAYHTTIDEDEKLMEGGHMEPRLKMAVGIRVGEKKVLHQIDEIFRGRELELDELEYYQERRLKDLGLVGEQVPPLESKPPLLELAPSPELRPHGLAPLLQPVPPFGSRPPPIDSTPLPESVPSLSE